MIASFCTDNICIERPILNVFFNMAPCYWKRLENDENSIYWGKIKPILFDCKSIEIFIKNLCSVCNSIPIDIKTWMRATIVKQQASFDFYGKFPHNVF